MSGEMEVFLVGKSARIRQTSCGNVHHVRRGYATRCDTIRHWHWPSSHQHSPRRASLQQADDGVHEVDEVER